MTVVSTLINIDFYKTTSGEYVRMGMGLESRRRALPSRLHLASNSLVKWKTSAARRSLRGIREGETEGGNAYLLYSAHSTLRPSITKLPCRLQKRRKNRRSLSRSSRFLRLSFTPHPSLFFGLPSRWIVFTFGDPVSRKRERKRLLRAAGY